MSRSYKKPWFTDNGNHRRWAKRQANKRVRRAREVSNGMGYKRIYNSWDICDWRFEWHPKWGMPLWKARMK